MGLNKFYSGTSFFWNAVYYSFAAVLSLQMFLSSTVSLARRQGAQDATSGSYYANQQLGGFVNGNLQVTGRLRGKIIIPHCEIVNNSSVRLNIIQYVACFGM